MQIKHRELVSSLQNKVGHLCNEINQLKGKN